jgi:subtilisin family serine protease
MRTPRRVEPRATVPLGLLAAGAALALLLAGGGGAGGGIPPEGLPAAAAWAGLVGGPRPHVSVGQRVIVVLKAPSLSDRVAPGATAADERRWSADALEAQRRLIARLALEGVTIRPEYAYTRVLDGFSAAIDSRGVSLLDAAPEVAGVYPVRVAYPATASEARAAALGAGPGKELVLPGMDGSGVTVALLDTGVDRSQPYLRGRVLPGYDVVRKRRGALAMTKPGDPASIEEHGTELAGVLVGAGGPSGLAGVATGATVLPLRVAGWQPDASGGWSIYARTDELVAGLERAVDPNANGDARDAARIALVGLAAPFAAFDDDPVALASGGAARLGTLVVAAAGNDGAAGPSFGSIAGPGGAPAALTIGAADLRAQGSRVRLVVRAGLRVLLDAVVPLAGAVAPSHTLGLRIAQARPGEEGSGSPGVDAFFDRRGYSLVAGRAALVPAGSAPRDVAEAAARAGAAAVLLDGARVPSGSLGVDALVPVPVVGLGSTVGAALRAALTSGANVGISIARVPAAANPAYGRVAAFSSHGLAYDGGIKPELVGPGVGIVTSAPGTNPDGSPRFATVSGTSIAAAAVAGAATLLAQSRPGLSPMGLRSALIGTAHRLATSSLGAQGAGLVDLAAADSTEVSADPATVSLGRGALRRVVVVRNLSPRRRTITVTVDGPASVRPDRVTIAPGGSSRVVVSARADALSAEGAVVLRVAGGRQPVRIPWAASLEAPGDLISNVRLSSSILDSQALAPALLTVRLGRLAESAGNVAVTPVARFDAALVDPNGQPLGVLTRLRDALPGTYAFALTGRAPAGSRLAPGRYTLRLLAFPTDGGRPTRRLVGFTVR